MQRICAHKFIRIVINVEEDGGGESGLENHVWDKAISAEKFRCPVQTTVW